MDSYRPGDVFEVLLASINKRSIDLSLDLAMNNFRDAYSTRDCSRFQTGREIDAIAKHFSAIFNDIADIESNSDLYFFIVVESMGPSTRLSLLE